MVRHYRTVKAFRGCITTHSERTEKRKDSTLQGNKDRCKSEDDDVCKRKKKMLPEKVGRIPEDKNRPWGSKKRCRSVMIHYS